MSASGCVRCHSTNTPTKTVRARGVQRCTNEAACRRRIKRTDRNRRRAGR